MPGSKMPPHLQNQHTEQQNSFVSQLYFKRGRSVGVKSKWEEEDVHFLFLNLCRATFGVQPTPSQDRCKLSLCGRHSSHMETPESTPGPAMAGYSSPGSEKNQHHVGCPSCSELTTAAICLGISWAHILHAGNSVSSLAISQLHKCSFPLLTD